MFANTGRQVGVKVPSGQLSSGEAPAGKVTHVVPCQFHAINFGDAQGRARQAVVMQAGNELYWLPNGEEWAAQLTTVNAEYKKQIFAELHSQNTMIPTEDEVDVAASLVASDEDPSVG